MTYNFTTDERFILERGSKLKNRLDSHGFPITEGVDKRVHRIIEALGGEIDVYVTSARQAFV